MTRILKDGRKWSIKYKKVFIVIVQKGFLRNNIVNMGELKRIGVDI
jgi:hypothetical protein